MPGESTTGASAAPATPLIYLDVDDEITSAAARIRAIDGDQVALVLPYGSRLATSRINFRLLAREAGERGKKLHVVCADPSARALAAAAGLPVHASVSAYEGRRSGGPAATEGGSPREAAASAAPAADGTDEEGFDPDEEDAGPGVAGVPVGGLSVDDEANTRVLSLPRTRPQRVPRVGPPRPPVRTGLAVGLGLAAVVLVIAGAMLALELLPSATVVLSPRSEAIGPIALTVDARSDVAAPDAATMTIPAQRITFDLETTHTVTATGVKVTETNASGTVTFSNNDTGGSNRIPAGAIVKTESGVEFATVAAVTLPPAFLFPFFPSTASVNVTAVEPGEGGNVEQETITVVPKGENKVLLQVTNREATAGGARTESPEISQDDVDTALLAIDEALAAELARQIDEGLGAPPDVDLFDQTQVVGEPQFDVDPQSLVGSESLSVELVATAEGSILGVDPTPIQALAETRLGERVTDGWTLAPGSTGFDLGEPSVLGTTITYALTIEAIQIRSVDADALADGIRGLLLSEARSRLDDYGDVEITLWPDWVTTIPKNVERIAFTVGDPVPAPSAAP